MSETAPPATIDTGIFRAYDIRGITTENLTEEVVYWIGRSFATAALAQQQSTAVIGRDGRLSSPQPEGGGGGNAVPVVHAQPSHEQPQDDSR